ncbi:MAG: response regulator [Candidatus Omnitrophota bacterium]
MNRRPLTTGEIALFCHVTYRCVLKWIEEGKITAYRTPGGHHRIRRSDFLAFLKKYSMPVPFEIYEIAEKKRILIVDDDKNMVKAVNRIFQLRGNYSVESASNGFDAGKKLLQYRPDLVILDIKMPGMDGYQVARQIKQSLGNNTKIIAISGYFTDDEKRDKKTGDIDFCINKPFDLEFLLKKVDELLR